MSEGQAREASAEAPHAGTHTPSAGPSSAGGRPLQTPGAPDTPTPPRARGGVVADPLALLAEVERERELRDSWYERCHEAEAEARRQRMRAEKAEAEIARWRHEFAELVAADDANSLTRAQAAYTSMKSMLSGEAG